MALLFALWLSFMGATGLTAGSVSLAWDASPSATGYRLWLASGTGPFLPILDVAGTTATWTFTGTTVQRFQVTATNAVGESGPSNVVTNLPAVTPPPPPTETVPPAPVLRANQVTGHRLDLSWTGIYAVTEIERSVEGGPWARLATVAIRIMHYSDTSVQKKYDYRYRCRQVNSVGAGPWSNDLIYSSR